MSSAAILQVNPDANLRPPENAQGIPRRVTIANLTHNLMGGRAPHPLEPASFPRASTPTASPRAGCRSVGSRGMLAQGGARSGSGTICVAHVPPPPDLGPPYLVHDLGLWRNLYATAFPRVQPVRVGDLALPVLHGEPRLCDN